MDDSQDSSRNEESWPHNSFQQNDFHMQSNSQSAEDQETYQHTYECNENDKNMDFTDHVDDGADSSDPNVVSGIYGIAQDCLELKQELAQIKNDIKLLQENELLLKRESEEKQKDLETMKIELLNEQDNHDNIDKKLNDEIELITAIGAQQEALNKQTKIFLEEEYTVSTLLESFDTEMFETKERGENISEMFQRHINQGKVTLKRMCDIRTETTRKKCLIIKEIQVIEDKLQLKIDELEKLQEILNVDYHKQIAILEYLKIKGDEEWSKHMKFDEELKQIQEHEDQVLILKEKEYSDIEEQGYKINKELIEIKQLNNVNEKYLEQLNFDKNMLNEQISKLQMNEASGLQNRTLLSEMLTAIVNEVELLLETLHAKACINEQLTKLNDQLIKLQEEKTNVEMKANETNKVITEAYERCNNLGITAAQLVGEKVSIGETKCCLELKRLSLLNEFEELKSLNESDVSNLQIQETAYIDKKELLEREIEEHNREFELNLQTVQHLSSEIFKSKEQLTENSEIVASLQNDVQQLTNSITTKQSDFESTFSTLQNAVNEKLIFLTNTKAEIDRHVTLQSKIVGLKNELLEMKDTRECEVKHVKDSYDLEIQTRRDELQGKKNELNSVHDAKKTTVSDLNAEIIDEQRKELHLVKTCQKLVCVKEAKKREIITLINVVKTLDMKLNTLAQTVADTNKGKESPIAFSASTVVSNVMEPVNMQKYKVPDDCQSSSSGVSMQENDGNWKKRLRVAQQMKQMKSQTLQSQTSTVPPAWSDVKTSSDTDEQLQKKTQPLPKTTWGQKNIRKY